MVCLHSSERNILIAADQILPKITPHIGVHPADSDADPLGAYLGSLSRFAGLPDDTLVLPSHGDPFTGLEARLAGIRAHHEERLQRLRDFCTEPRTVMETTSVLFRQLPLEQVGFGLSEALAHLRYLVRRGEMEETGGALWRFRTLSRPPQMIIFAALRCGRRRARRAGCYRAVRCRVPASGKRWLRAIPPPALLLSETRVTIYLPIAEIPVAIFTIFAMGLAVGFISGMFGVGGGFLMTPLLIFTGVPAAVAVASVFRAHGGFLLFRRAVFSAARADRSAAGRFPAGRRPAGYGAGGGNVRAAAAAGAGGPLIGVSYVLLLTAWAGSCSWKACASSCAVLAARRPPCAGPAPIAGSCGFR